MDEISLRLTEGQWKRYMQSEEKSRDCLIASATDSTHSSSAIDSQADTEIFDIRLDGSPLEPERKGRHSRSGPKSPGQIEIMIPDTPLDPHKKYLTVPVTCDDDVSPTPITSSQSSYYKAKLLKSKYYQARRHGSSTVPPSASPSPGTYGSARSPMSGSSRNSIATTLSLDRSCSIAPLSSVGSSTSNQSFFPYFPPSPGSSIPSPNHPKVFTFAGQTHKGLNSCTTTPRTPFTSILPATSPLFVPSGSRDQDFSTSSLSCTSSMSLTDSSSTLSYGISDPLLFASVIPEEVEQESESTPEPKLTDVASVHTSSEESQDSESTPEPKSTDVKNSPSTSNEKTQSRVRRLLQIPKSNEEDNIRFQEVYMSHPVIVDAAKQVRRLVKFKRQLEKLDSESDLSRAEELEKAYHKVQGKTTQAIGNLREHNQKMEVFVKEIQQLLPGLAAPFTEETMESLKAACERLTDRHS
jgi:hypothetical protein